MIVKFDEVKINIEEAVLNPFIKDDKLDTVEWEHAEAKVSAQFKRFVPCFSRELLDLKDKKTGNFLCKDLLLFWSDFFNYAHRNLANEKNTDGFSAIKQKYDNTVDFLEKNGTYYCSLLNECEQTSPLQGIVRTFVAKKMEFY